MNTVVPDGTHVPLRVVVAEDDPLARTMLTRILSKWGYVVEDVENGQQAWEALERNGARLVITDWAMPFMTGVDLCRRIRTGVLPAYVYTILLTSKDDKEAILEGFSSGADDYLTKPFDRDELRARVRAGERIVTLEAELREARGRLEIMASTDELTGIANRRAALSRLQEALARCARGHEDLVLIALDVDHFKKLNDTYGHAAGDAVLREFVIRVKSQLREYDVLGRIGGEEFLAVLPGVSLEVGTGVAERVRQSVGNTPFHVVPDAEIPVTVSIGVSAASSESVPSVDALMQLADEALYQAKKSGRNQVVVGGIIASDTRLAS
jgi:diguanylate cyclase (GGDEF)-like protein